MNDEHKNGVHLHIGGLIILIIIAFVLFKVNIKETIATPQFQSNLEFVEEKGKQIWENYLSKPLMYIWNSAFSDILKNGLKDLQKNGGFFLPDNQPQPYAEEVKNEPLNQMSKPVSN